METNTIKEILAENKWRLLQDEENGGYDQDVLVRYIPGIPRNEFPKILAHLKSYTSAKNGAISTTVENPITTPEGEWTGTYTGGRIWYKLMQDGAAGKTIEGTYTLYQALHKGGTSEANIVTENGCRYQVTQTWYWQTSTLEALPASSSGITYSRTTPILDAETGCWTYAIEKRTRLTQTVTEYTSERDLYSYEQKTHYKGVYNGDVDNAGAAITLPSMASQTAGTISRIARNKNEDCTQDIDVTKLTAIQGANAVKSKEIRLTTTVAVALDKNDDAAETLPTSQTAGQINTVEVEQNQFNKFDNKITTQTANAVTNIQQTKKIDQFETVTEAVNKHQTSAGTLPTKQTAGSIVTVQTEQNEFQRHDVKTTTRTAATVADVVAAKTISKFEIVEEDVDRNQLTAQTSPVSQTAGQIQTVKSTKNEFQRYDHETTTRTASAVSDAEQSKIITAFESRTVAQNRNQTAAAILPTSQTAGTIVEVGTRNNEFDRHDTATTTRTAVAASSAETEKTITGDETVARVMNRNQVNVADLPTALTPGTIVEVLNRLNEFARYDTNTTTKTATYQHQEYSWTDRYGTAYAAWGKNATASQYADAVSGMSLTSATNNNITKIENKYGLIDYLITKIPTASGGASVGESSGSGTLTYEQRGILWNATKKRNQAVKRTVTVTYSLAWYATMGAAYSAISGGNQGSRVIGQSGLSGAYKTTVSYGSWTAETELS